MFANIMSMFMDTGEVYYDAAAVREVAMDVLIFLTHD